MKTESPPPPLPLPPLTLVKQICRALDAKKAEALRVSDVREQSSITDYIIVATGTADTHLRALRVELEKVLDAAGARILGMDGQRESGWVVVDAFDVMIHLFLGETRQRYRLEQLWQDAPVLDLAELLAEPKPARTARKPVVKKTPASAIKKAAAKTAAAKKPSTSATGKAPASKKATLKATAAARKPTAKVLALKTATAKRSSAKPAAPRVRASAATKA